MVISSLTLGRIDLEPWSTALLLVLVHWARASNWSVSGGSWWGITQQLSPWSYQRKLPRSLIYAMLPMCGHCVDAMERADVMLISESSASVPASELR